MTDELVVVYTAVGQIQASIIKSMLETAGIPVMSVQEGAGAAYGLAVGTLGQVMLLVPAKYAEEARALLKEVGEDQSGEDEEESAEN